MKAIYKLEVDFGRMGVLSGIFVSEQSEVDALIGKTFYGSDILGKHSEIHFVIGDKAITKITDDFIAIEVFERFGFSSGINPFDYISEEDED